MNRPVAPSDPPTGPLSAVALAAARRRDRRPSPTPRQVEQVEDPPLYRQVAAEMLCTPLPPAYVRRGP